MAQSFNDNLYLIDLSYLNTPSEVVYDLSSILEAEPAKNQRIKLKLGKVDFNKSQLLSIKSLIESINSTVAIVRENLISQEMRQFQQVWFIKIQTIWFLILHLHQVT